MKKFVLSIFFIFCFTSIISAQGVFTSAATGNWNASGSWTLSSGSDVDGIPDADDDVTISASHTITVDANSACNNLTLQGVSSGTRLAIGVNTLEVNGTLNGDGTTLSTTLITTTYPGVLKFVGNSRVLVGASWAANTPELAFEVAINSDQTGTATTALKAKRMIFTSGTFSTTGEIRPDSNVANTGSVIVGNGAIVISTTRFSRTGTANTPFASLTINGTGKIIFNGTGATSLPVVASSFPVYTYSSGAVIEYQGGTQTIADIAYPNLIINATTASTAKTWSPAANRTATSITITQGILAYGNGVVCTVYGNILVAANGTIAPGSSANRFSANGSDRTFTLNGTARVTSNETQTGAATSAFSYQYSGFATYTFASSSWISFRSPTSTPVTQGINGITGSPFGNVEIAAITNLGSPGSNTHTFKTNVEIAGILAFPRLGANTSLIINFGSNTVKVGGAIQLNGSNTSTQSGGRTYNMETSTVELNGTSAQNTLGGTDLPAAFYNLKLNNSSGVTVANAITVSNILSLAGNNTYTNLNNISGYTGLEYAATTAQTTGSEFGASITNLTINNSSGVILGDSKIVNGTLSLTSGDLDLNGKVLTLGGSALVIETAGNTIKGTTGTITTTRSLNAPSLSNVAGLGATLTSSADLGSTVITRGHTVQTGNTNNGVGRYYDITPTTNTGLNASLVFSYDESELNGIPEADLRLFRSTDGGTSWTLAGGTVDEGSNNVTLSGINAFSRWTLGDVNDPLPVELTALSYNVKDGFVNLSWTTATEVNSYKFEVERSADKSVWSKIGEVTASGNSNSPKEYSFTDNSVTSGQIVYRLKIVDNDGSFAYSKEIEVLNSKPSTYQLSQNYPNPFNPTTTISYQLPVEANVKLMLFTITGEMVRELVNSNQSAGNYNVTLDASGLASGTYIYRLVAGDFVSVKKMVVLK